MANYICKIRTNYFHVKDEAAFRKLMSRVSAEDSIEIFENEKDAEVFGFGSYGSIYGVCPEGTDPEDEDYEPDYDEFVKQLQACIADDDAVIILESGYEKLRYLVGQALVITSTGYKRLDIAELAAEEAARMLGNQEWRTRCDY